MNEQTNIRNSTIEASIVTYDKSGNKLAEFKLRGDPNTATGKAAWFWGVLEAMIRDAGLDKPSKKGLLDFFSFGGV